MSLSDLHTAGFWGRKNATLMAESEACEISQTAAKLMVSEMRIS
jgi:hypothetical protein